MRIILLLIFLPSAFSASDIKFIIETVAKLAIDYFGTHYVVFLHAGSDVSGSFEGVRSFSKLGLFSTAMGWDELMELKTISRGLQKQLVVTASNIALAELQVAKSVDLSELHWLHFDNDLDERLLNMNIPYNCKFLLAQQKNNVILIKELYKPSSSSDLVVNLLSRFVQGEKIQRFWTDFYSRRRNLNGALLKYHSHLKDPCKDQSFAGGNVIPCIHKMVWDVIAQAINATTEQVFVPVRTPPLLAQTFIDESLQVSITSYFFTSATVAQVHFFWPTFQTELAVFTKIAGEDISWDRYFRPFTTDIWITVLVLITANCVIFYISRRLRIWNIQTDPSIEDCRPEQCWTPLFAFLYQGTSEPSRSTWERIMLAFTLLAPAVLIPAYSAALTSFLAVEIPNLPFTDLAEMKDHPKYKLTSTKDYDLHGFLESNADETSVYLSKSGLLRREDSPANDVEAVQRMCREPLSFIASPFTITALKPTCKFYRLPKAFVVFHQSMTMQRNSPYENMFNIIMRKMRFSGVLQTLKYIVTKNQIFDLFMEERVDNSLPPVDLEGIALLLLLLVFVVFISTIVLAFEIFWSIKVRRSKLLKRKKIILR